MEPKSEKKEDSARGTTATGRQRREVPPWARKGSHVTVVAGGSSYKGVVTEELPSAIYVSHRLDESRRLGTYSLASVDGQPEGRLAQPGYEGMYRNHPQSRVERVYGDDGDAPLSEEAAAAVVALISSLPAERAVEALKGLIDLVSNGPAPEDPTEWIENNSNVELVRHELRRLSAE